MYGVRFLNKCPNIPSDSQTTTFYLLYPRVLSRFISQVGHFNQFPKYFHLDMRMYIIKDTTFIIITIQLMKFLNHFRF